MTPAILASKRYRRYLERVWRRNPTALNRSRLTRQTHLCNRRMLFTLYTTPLSSMSFEHAIPHHPYADDSHLYVSFASGDYAAALNGLQSCLASVQSWMSTNKLKLNPDKTEFLLIGNKRQRSNYLSMFPIQLLGVKTNPAESARNLGVIFD